MTEKLSLNIKDVRKYKTEIPDYASKLRFDNVRWEFRVYRVFRS